MCARTGVDDCVFVRACVTGAWVRACACGYVDLLIQFAKRRHIVTAACLAPPHFSTISYKWDVFWKKLWNMKTCILIFCITFTWNISHSKNNSVRYCYKCRNVFTCSTCYSCQILMKREFSRQIFDESSNIKSYQNLSSGSRVVHVFAILQMRLKITTRTILNENKIFSKIIIG
jgi:hypothetical protein